MKNIPLPGAPANIILAMHPAWSEKLLNGSKTVELRRTSPKYPLPAGCTIYLYQQRHIIGQVRLTKHTRLHGAADICCHAVPLFRDAGMDTPADVTRYLAGAKNPCLYHITAPIRYKHPLPWHPIVQSWCYVPPDTPLQPWPM